MLLPVRTRYSATREGGAIVLGDGVTGTSARVRPAEGMNVVSFRTTVGGDELEVLSPRGIPILFPFPNRVPRGRYTWLGREHALDVNEHGRPNHNHGLVRARPWRLVALDADAKHAQASGIIDLGAWPDAMRQYPFPCEVRVDVVLEDGRLGHHATVTNRGSEPMPMGYGIHPWFAPALGGDRAATEARIPARRRWELEEHIPTGRTVPARDVYDFREWRPLGTRLYDDVFTDIARRPDGWSEAAIRYPRENVAIALEADAAYREWVLFADPARDAIAVEPYSCATNAVNLQASGVDAGLITLPAGATWRAFFWASARRSS